MRTLKKALRPMTLNVKDPEAHRLAKAIADETGETITRAVTEALRERYQRIQHRLKKASVEELLAIVRRISSEVKRPYADHAEDFPEGAGRGSFHRTDS
jgi:antitoxin VapB